MLHEEYVKTNTIHNNVVLTYLSLQTNYCPFILTSFTVVFREVYMTCTCISSVFPPKTEGSYSDTLCMHASETKIISSRATALHLHTPLPTPPHPSPVHNTPSRWCTDSRRSSHVIMTSFSPIDDVTVKRSV